MKFQTKLKPTLPVLNVVSFVMVVIVGLGFIAQVNHSSSKGFQMKDLQKQMNQLTVANEQLEYQVAQAQSVDHVATHLKMLGMVPVKSVAYTSVGGSSVAVNR